MRHAALHLLVTTLAAACLTACGGGNDTPDTAAPTASATTVAVIGDVPYGTSPTDTAEFGAAPAFLQSITADTTVSALLHGGDIHSGKEYCTESYDRAVAAMFGALTVPVIYTPGDNEWIDCHKKKQGGGTWNTTTGKIDYVVDASGKQVSYQGGDPVANLALVRTTFFPKSGQTLGKAMAVHSQATEYDKTYPGDAAFVENVWWMQSNVLFVTLNIPGGSNNGSDIWYGAPTMSSAQTQEISARTAATLRWIDTAFSQARTAGALGVVLLVQADMWDPDNTDLTAGRAHITHYKPFIDAIAARTSALGKPVLLLNGDSHTFRSDNPLVPSASCVKEPVAADGSTSGGVAGSCADVAGQNLYGSDAYQNQPGGYNVPNFHRVVFHGSTMPMEWLKLTIDPAASAPNGAYAFGPFAWQRIVVK
jgi:hypothetical protein